MPKREPRDWEELERELHAAGVSPEEIESGARKMLALARGGGSECPGTHESGGGSQRDSG
ncbi:MAG: hypothetical protein ACRDP7_40450 [Trebonia sp.]